jgi:beta-glucanase (GH16 family)
MPADWSDEFDGPANTLPNPAKWTYDLGGGWGKNELETYTNSIKNVHLDGMGHLVIHVAATRRGYTSARLKTQGMFAAHYGDYLEARIKLPTGQGIWPTFWLLGVSFDGSNWPSCGEIDVMENLGSQPSINRGSLHGQGYSGANAISAAYVLPGGQRFSDGFHTFAIRWARGSITFLVDSTAYQTVTAASIPPGAPWVFDAPFFLLLSVAVGGNYAGPPDSTTAFPQDMLVDYVRYTASTETALLAMTNRPAWEVAR